MPNTAIQLSTFIAVQHYIGACLVIFFFEKRKTDHMRFRGKSDVNILNWCDRMNLGFILRGI
jgi:hypothetical protein